MSSVAERVEAPSPVEPVSPQKRSLSGWDMAILWGDLGIGLLVMVTGALLVPALGFGEALLAVVLGSLIGVSLLALGAVCGADHGVATMALLRPVLGVRGSWAPAAINALQLIGWTAVELWAMSYVADIVSRRAFGFSARPLWLVLAATICAALAAWGPIGVTRIWMKRFAAWAIGLICIVVTILVLMEAPDTLTAAGAGGWPTFGAAMDLVIAIPISWLPLVADYSRFARTRGGAFTGTFAGYLVANIWLYSLGILLVTSTGSAASPAGIAAAILSLGGGSVAGLLFLAGLLVGETDEAFADIYSGSVSLQNIFPRAPSVLFVGGITGIAAILAAWLTMERYEVFLFLLGSLFVPLFGLLFADHFLNRDGEIDATQLDTRSGPYWFFHGIRPAAFAAWVAGFVAFQWMAPAGPQWWTDMVRSLLGPSPLAGLPWVPASVPAFGIAFLLGLALSKPGAGIVESR